MDLLLRRVYEIDVLHPAVSNRVEMVKVYFS